MALDKTFSTGELLTAANVNDHLLGIWCPIDKRVIPSGSPVASVSFLSIDSNFRLFRLTITYSTSAGEPPRIRFNNDTGTNYSAQIFNVGGTTTNAFRQTAQTSILLMDSSPLSAAAHVLEVTAAKYTTTMPAGVRASYMRDTAANVTYGASGGSWNNTAALINRIDVLVSTGTFYGVVALEGMRGV